MGKSCYLCGNLERENNRKNQKTNETDLPLLLIITPTISQAIILAINSVNDVESSYSGIYTLGNLLIIKIVSVHQLQKSGETL